MEGLLRRLSAFYGTEDLELVARAFLLAEERHRPQQRSSGEPYITHPVAVAHILADYRLDAPTLAAALLHDVVEDTPTTLEEVSTTFSPEISMLVDGVTKLTSISSRQGRDAPTPRSKQQAQAENLRKIFLAMARDLRVILIKLADRLHNLRTLGALRPQKQEAISTETLEIFAPIASRLGVFQMKIELEDLSFRYRYPKEYEELTHGLGRLRPVLERAIEEARNAIEKRLEALKIKARLEWREKHLYSTFKKIQRTHRPLEDVYDLLALRIIVDKVEDCYSILGLIHSIWVPMKDRIKDYIAVPKSNNYRSLHTTVYGPGDHPLEIQIRTWEMHQVNEMGIAAHWAYKEGKAPPSKDTAMFKEIYPWIRAILDWDAETRDAKEYVDNLKVDLLSNEVFVFTPGGDVIDLPTGSVPIDFAYRVHTQVGHRCIGAKVNGKMVPFDYKLQNADVVEVITSKNGTPSLDWLRICGSNQARNKIRNWFKKERREENVLRGRDILRRELTKQRMDGVLNDEDLMTRIAKQLNFEKGDDLLASLGFGETSLAQFLGRLREELPQESSQSLLPAPRRPAGSKKKSGQPVRVKGIENILIRFSKCCAPVPGDEVIGYITLGKGVSVHVVDCPNLATMIAKAPERVIEVEWEAASESGSYPVELEIDAWDRDGLLSEVMGILNEARIPTRSCKAWAKKDRAFVKVAVDILHKRQLEDLIKRLKKVREVISVSRTHTQAGHH
ncbi:MAG: bifunctional (p)ppGpp synthetase/guanosine-3',5'-bis(diphosphate) 3'-pyrophosphohydrolase [Candidatus Eremiobacteraeota bacterium]|nr:bifunctional (p)ppGpp synthetase/guanosine-3',5'-bis(diphosphate) 3'-pyrophosphohydrolase [Candidatus Eremiobacteraeota bacterium]MCW5866082.1 bifunctional (p)ppGpp synthetase/guanosine-3',5'-bis(diphosphate) 3'-pyrophosphohydrolase [Candidatus Eremiobacteraeota bacterium]